MSVNGNCLLYYNILVFKFYAPGDMKSSVRDDQLSDSHFYDNSNSTNFKHVFVSFLCWSL